MSATDSAQLSQDKKRKRSMKAKQEPLNSHKKQKTTAEEQAESSSAVIRETRAKQTLDKSDEESDEGESSSLATEKSTVQAATNSDAVELAQASGHRRRRRNRKQRQPGTEKETHLVIPAPTKDHKWTTTKSTAGRFLTQDPHFSADEAYIYAANAKEVKVFSTATSLEELSIPAPGGSSITAIACTDSQIYVATESGLVEAWSVEDRSMQRVVKVSGRITAIAVQRSDGEESDQVVVASRSGSNYHISLGEKQIYSTTNSINKLELHGSFIVAAGPKILLVGRASSSRKDSALPTYQFAEAKISASITCFAAKPRPNQKSAKREEEQLSVALGTDSGEIFLYDNVASLLSSKTIAGTLSQPRILHWHREAVGALAWSKDGKYLISGGRETVLVIWQLDTGKKQFLPHLTADVQGITVSPSGSSYALQLADNSIIVLSTSELTPTTHIAGLQAQHEVPLSTITSPYSNGSGAPAVIHPLHQDQLLLAVPNSSYKSADGVKTLSRPFLQTYDVSFQRSIYRQALTRNNTTDLNRAPDGSKIHEPDVPLLSISHDGQWLATVEQWQPALASVDHLGADPGRREEEAQYRREVYLKIWHWNQEKQVWALNTRIDSPHLLTTETRAGAVRSLTSDPVEVGFASLGEDGYVRIWKPKTRLRNGVLVRGANAEGLVEWTCRHSVALESESGLSETDGYSEAKKTLGPACIAYSDDGSILAASQSPSLSSSPATAPPMHFIQSETGTIIHTRSGMYSGSLSALAFLDRYLVVLSSDGCHVWDVVTESSKLSIDLGSSATNSSSNKKSHAQTSLLCIDKESSSFAIARARPGSAPSSKQKSLVQVFTPDSSSPILEADFDASVTALLAAKGRKGYTVLTSKAEIYQLAPDSSSSAPLRLNGLRHGVEGKDVSSQDVEGRELAVQDLDGLADDEDDEMGDDGLAVEDGLATDGIVLDNDLDRPVVRPEQLAHIFDQGVGGQGAAFMPVKSMFDAVVGLCARRLPRQVSSKA